MNIEEFREYCLSLPGVTEATPFEKFLRGKFLDKPSGRARRTILVFYVNSHIFCYFNVDDFSNITIKCNPTEMTELKEKYQAIGEPFNGDKRYWISVQPNMDLSDEELKDLVRNSYEIIKSKKR
ncbi:MAG: MmcQ/YjbR family DNA-binding protein [Prevotella sp.]|nr:MmcQ/YjbR family DNA-binding protein [Prevotella sp.]